MNFFDSIVQSISNPDTNTQQSDLSQLMEGIGRLSSENNVSKDDISVLLASLGKQAKSNLKMMAQQESPQKVEQVVDEAAGSPGISSDLLEKILGRQGTEQVASEVENKSSLNKSTIAAMIPIILPLVMNLLKSGQSNRAQTGGSASGFSNNPILAGFLDSDRDGDVDVQDMIAMAGKFLSSQR